MGIAEKTRLLRKLYPETGAGGFTAIDGTVEFWTRVHALLRPDMVVLEFGAGRGAAAQEDDVLYRRHLLRLKGKASKVVGVDVDPAVLSHPGVDEKVVVEPDQALPFPAGTFDLIVSDFVFEHVEDVPHVASELTRVLKPGGWICARTTNRFGYVAIGATLIPNRLHSLALRWLQPHRKVEDIFPTRYRLCTKNAVRRAFPTQHFENFSYYHDQEPSYCGESETLWRLFRVIHHFTLPILRNNLHIFLRKRDAN